MFDYYGVLHGVLYQPFPVLQTHAHPCNNISEAKLDAAFLVACSCNSVQQLLRCRPHYGSATQQQCVAAQHSKFDVDKCSLSMI